MLYSHQVVGEVKYKGFIDATVQIVKRKGIVNGLYAGLSAAYLRQWTYGQCPSIEWPTTRCPFMDAFVPFV